MKDQTREDPKILAAAERQMQAWSMTASIEDHCVRMKDFQQLTSHLKYYVAISREAGAGGSTVAEIVGRKLGWEVLDKGLLDRVAERYHSNRLMLDLVDETPCNWVYDVLGTWMDSKVIPHETYVAQLSRVVVTAAQHANVVIVGRGAQFLLPREKGISVRLVAPEEFRIEHIMKSMGMNASDAKRYIRGVDQGRLEFARRFFHHDLTDPHLYDLIINTQQLGFECSADIIFSAIAHRTTEQVKRKVI